MERRTIPSRRGLSGQGLALLCSLSLGVIARPALAIEYVLGPADSLALDQPRITFGLTNESANPPALIGPTFPTLALLDTGANGILLATLSYAGGENYGQPAFPFDYDASGVIDPDEQLAHYAELGVAGTTLLDVHEPHGLRIEDSDGVQRLIGNDLRAFGDSTLNLGSFSAIVGMPAMTGYAVEVDLRPMASLSFQRVAFHDTLADAPFESASNAFVDLRIIEPEHTDTTLPVALRPTFAGLPVIDHVDMSHTGGANSGGATLTAEDYTFLVDTGAQTMIISQQMAIDMGIDFSKPFAQGGDTVDYLEVGGIGGTVQMPLVVVDRFIMPTQAGIDLVYTDLIVGVLDIDGAPFDAVFGMNMLTTGYLELAFGGGGGELTDPLATPEVIELFIQAGTVSTTQDLIDFQIIRISSADLQELVDLGLILNPDDPLEVFNQLRALEELVNAPATTALFDKVVFDFTPTDGTASMRLDFASIVLQLPGDTDNDGDIDDSDLGTFLANYTGPIGNVGKTPAQGDTDGDGDVDDSDLGTALAGYTGPLSPATVPEPTTAVVLGLAGWLGLFRRRAALSRDH